jgi:catechol 1,2-dioxygenase
MVSKLVQSSEIQRLLDRVSGMTEAGGDPRTKQIVRRIVAALYSAIEEFDVSPAEFWGALDFLQQGAAEFGLIAPGLGFDHFLDLRMDEKDKAADIDEGGTPRTIEGPLYVPGAPLAKSFARLDDGTDNGEVLIMSGRVLGKGGRPIADAIVDVWHANSQGNYSYFDPSQSRYNNRRRIETDAQGQYKFRSIVPRGYAVPPNGATERLLSAIGRHGKRPAHIHFFVSASGYRHLTTQINIADDPLLHDDFAHATREGLIPDIVRQTDAAAIRAQGLNAPYSEIAFDFTLCPARTAAETEFHDRPRAAAL